MEITWQPGLKAKAEEKLLNSNKKKKKSEKVNLLKYEIEENDDDFTDDHRESLELLTIDDDIDTKRDYNLRDMIKSYKKSTRKKLSDPVETIKIHFNETLIINVFKLFRLNQHSILISLIFNLNQQLAHNNLSKKNLKNELFHQELNVKMMIIIMILLLN